MDVHLNTVGFEVYRGYRAICGPDGASVHPCFEHPFNICGVPVLDCVTVLDRFFVSLCLMAQAI